MTQLTSIRWQNIPTRYVSPPTRQCARPRAPASPRPDPLPSPPSQEAPPPLPDWIHQRLLDRAGRTITFLTNLTTEVPLPGNRVKKAAMPMSAFRGAKALAFVFRTKYGFLGSYQQEVAFVTRKIVAANGALTWSAPLFLRSHSVGLGVTLGYFRGGFCTAILDDKALEYCLTNRYIPTARGTFLIDMNGAKVRGVTLDSAALDNNVTSSAVQGTRANYFRAEAMLMDFSLNMGRFKKYTTMNELVYGAATPEEVLGGGVPCPAEFLTVMDVLKRYTEASMRGAPGTAKQRGGAGLQPALAAAGSGGSR